MPSDAKSKLIVPKAKKVLKTDFFSKGRQTCVKVMTMKTS